ncbi:MAG: hypothetical protein R3E01_18150 [Pirellulaceae bacterium]|nr:hypothetical protein [Planctomycetales bacterium]
MNHCKTLVIPLTLVTIVITSTSVAQAQFDSINQYYRQRAYQNKVAAYSGASVYYKPTVSPYVRLTNMVGSTSGLAATRYQSFIRPQVERRFADARKPPTPTRMPTPLENKPVLPRMQSQGVMATGHPSRYLYYSHYYQRR